MRIAFLAGFGLLPLWLSLMIIVTGTATMPWATASFTLWTIPFAVMASGVTMLIALMALAIHDGIPGSSKRKLLFSAGFVAFACGIPVGYGVKSSAQKAEARDVQERERNQVRQFVRSHADVRAASVDIRNVYAELDPRSGPGPTVRYNARVHGRLNQLRVYASLDRSITPPTLRLLCIKPYEDAPATLTHDPCAQPSGTRLDD